MTTTQDFSHLRALAKAALPGPHHIYTNARDSNNWEDNEKWHVACEPQTVIAMLDALEALQAEALALKAGLRTCVGVKDQALARLAELEKQEPVIYQAKTKPGFLSTSAYAWEDCEKADFLVYEADGVHVRGLYAAAGASLVATPIVAWAKSTPRKLRITTMDMCGEDGWRPLGYTAAGASPVEPSQAGVVELELSDAEIKKISSDLTLYEDYQPESCQADYLDPVKFARAIIAVINAKGR